MGKYMKKSKITSDVKVVTEGVRTRARAQAALADSSSFIQLRNRPIEKPPVNDSKKFLQKLPEVDEDCKKLSSKKSSKLSNRSCSVKLEEQEDVEGCFGNKAELLDFNCETTAEDFSVEGSFGDNYLDFESRDNTNNYNNRSTRESTPCNLISDPDTIVTPGSTTRRMGSAANNLRRDNLPQNIPTTNEMEEFFACAEHRQLKFFTEKYNFDVVNEKPLPGGRYDWF